MTGRINTRADKALREAMDNVAHAEEDHIEAPLARLDEMERTEAIGLAIMVADWAIVDACGTQWPTDASVRRLAESLATGGQTAKRLQLDTGQIYAYLSRVVLAAGPVEDVVPDEPMFTRIPVIVAQRAIVSYSPKEMGIWDYLDQIESAIEAAWALNATVLPAAIMRAYLPKTESLRERQRADLTGGRFQPRSLDCRCAACIRRGWVPSRTLADR
jgi:hypothetical protein